MYIFILQRVHVPRTPKRWTVATARQQLPRLLAMAAREPQAVYKRDTLVATVVSPELASKIEVAQAAEARGTLADDLEELHRICVEENYVMEPPPRVDRVVALPEPVSRRAPRRKKPRR